MHRISGLALLFASAILCALSQPASAQETASNLKAAIAERNGQRDYAGALEASHRLVDHVRTTLGPEHREYARAIQLLGFAYQNLGQLEEAERHHANAVRLAETNVDAGHPAQVYFRLPLVELLLARGARTEALEILQETHRLAVTSFGGQDPTTQRAQFLLAGLYSSLRRDTEATDLYRSLIEAQRASLSSANETTIFTIAQFAGHITRTGDHGRAARVLSEAYDTVEGPGPERATARRILDYAFGVLYTEWGLFTDAERNFRKALDGVVEDNGQAFTLPMNGLAGALLKQGRDAEAATMFERLVEVSSRLESRGIPTGLDQSGIRGNLLVAYRKLGRFADGQRLAQDIFNGLDSGRIKVSPRDEVTLLQQAGGLLYAGGDYARAGQFYTLAMGKAEAAGVPERQMLSIQSDVLNIAVALGRGREALPLMRQVMFDRSRLMGVDHPEAINGAISMAHLLLTLDDPTDEAKIRAEGAIYGIETSEFSAQRFAMPDDAAASRRLIGYSAAYAIHLETLWREAERSPFPLDYQRYAALTSMQRAMTGESDLAIASMASRRAAAIKDNALAALIDERRMLQSRIADLQREADRLIGSDDATSQTRKAELDRSMRETGARYANLQGQLQSRFPAYFEFVRPEPVLWDDATALLAGDEAALLILPMDFGTHVMVVTKDETEFAWHKSALTADDLSQLVEELRVGLDQSPDREFGDYAQPFDRNLAHRLYRELVEPVEASLANKSHVFFAGAGAMSSLPLSVLVTEPPSGDDLDSHAMRTTAWLADRWALVQIPSLQSLRMLRRLQRLEAGADARARAFDGFGDPVLAPPADTDDRGAAPAFNAVFDGSSRSAEGVALASVDGLRRLSSLPNTATELEMMRLALSAPTGAVRLGDQATETAVKSADLSRTRILAFATHGLLAGDVEANAEPGLVFTPPAAATPEDDGLLVASEVAALSLNADWVILSACNTAGGEGPGAPGLSGLARAFFQAGARNLLASHWPVRDDVAPQLTLGTIEGAKAPNASRAQAFAEAVRTLRMDERDPTLAHPAAWAPFVMVGDR